MIASHFRSVLLAWIAVFAMVSGTRAEAPEVVVTLKPIHSLVAGVMAGVAEPELLISGGGSPHAYALRPSQARSLAGAALVVRASEHLESFLNRSLDNLAPDAHILTLDQTKGLTLYKAREGGVWEHDARPEHARPAAASQSAESYDHGEQDPHFWLDPGNAAKLTMRIAGTLSKLFPEYAAAFTANAHGLRQRLAALDLELAAATKPLHGKPYIVFHDAYRYFEEHYALRPAGAVSVSPDRLPGARRLVDIRERIRREQAICVFAEPQFEPRIVATLIEGTDAKRGTLDPLGAELAPGPGLYFALMRNLAENLKGCLAPASQ